MSRRTKWLGFGAMIVLVMGMMFTAASRSVYRGGILTPLSGMAVRDRSVEMEEASQQLYYMRVLQIDNVQVDDIDARISKDLISKGFRRDQGVAGWTYYRKSSASPSTYGDVVVIQSYASPHTVYVSDFHRANTFEVMIARLTSLGKEFPRGDQFTGPPKQFVEGR